MGQNFLKIFFPLKFSKSENFWKNILIPCFEIGFFCEIFPKKKLNSPSPQILFTKTLTSSDQIQTKGYWIRMCTAPSSYLWIYRTLSCSLLGLPSWATMTDPFEVIKKLSGFTILKCRNLQTWIPLLNFPMCILMPNSARGVEVEGCTVYPLFVTTILFSFLITNISSKTPKSFINWHGMGEVQLWVPKLLSL